MEKDRKKRSTQKHTEWESAQKDLIKAPLVNGCKAIAVVAKLNETLKMPSFS